jgi:tetratricopeptide (TPR) repeat protein
MRQGAYENAVVIFSEVLEKVPRAPKVHANMGFALMQLGRYQEAVEHFEAAKGGEVAAADDATLLHNWANALEKLDRLEKSDALYQQAVDVDPGRAAVYINWGNLLTRMDRLEDAALRYKSAIDNDPQAPLSWFNYGYTLERLSRHQEALASYQSFLGFTAGAPSDLRDHARRFVAQAAAAGEAKAP